MAEPATSVSTVPLSTRRLVTRWMLLLVFVAVLGTVFVHLGDWQLERLRERQERNATTLINAQAPIRPYEDVFNREITDDDQWQRVEARGTFDPAHQFVVRYRTNGGDRGYEVVTPLLTTSGAVLVDRGFIPVGPGTQIPATAPAPPAGQVTVVGHVRRDENGRRSAVTPAAGTMRLIDSGAIAPHLGYPVADGYIGAISIEPSQSGEFMPVALPDVSEGPHFWYAVQWFLFAALAIAGIVIFIRGDLRDRREAMSGSPHGSGAD